MKTKEELNALKEEYEALGKKLAELSDDELRLIAGGKDLSEAVSDMKTGTDSEEKAGLPLIFF